jgi:ABC-type nitrate/sulfonate/bicarbonate transport system ATPase subunit
MCSGADILLCDEPLSGLDAVTRYFVINDFKNTLSRLKISALFITHDLHEAQQINDNILLLTKNGLVKLPKGINETDFIAQISH